MEPIYVGGTTGSGSGFAYDVDLTSLTGGAGSSPQEGDVVVVVTGFSHILNLNPGIDTFGYTEVYDGYANDTRDANLSVSYKRMGATPDTTVRVYGPNSSLYGGATVVHVWRGVDDDTVLDVVHASASGTNGAQADAPEVTPINPGSVVLACMLATGDTTPAAKTVPSGMANFVFASGAGSSSSCIAGVSSYLWASGAYNPAAWTGGESTSSDSWCAVTLVLRTSDKTMLPGAASITIGANEPERVTGSTTVTLSPANAELVIGIEQQYVVSGIAFFGDESAGAITTYAPDLALSDHKTLIPGLGDPYYDYVAALLRFDDGGIINDGFASTTDEVPDGWWYRKATMSTAQVKAGGGSVYINRSSNDYLASYAAGYGNVGGYPVGANDFCIEMWVYPTDKDRVRGLASQRPYSNSYISYSFAINSDNTLIFEVSINGSTIIAASSTTSVEDNAWNHVVAERYDGYLWVYLNGYRAGDPVYVGDGALYTTNIPFYLGKRDGYDTSPSQPGLTGYIDEFRLTIGAARYRGVDFYDIDEPLVYLPLAVGGGADIEVEGHQPSLAVVLELGTSTFDIPAADLAIVGHEPESMATLALSIVGHEPSVGISPSVYSYSGALVIDAKAPVLSVGVRVSTSNTAIAVTPVDALSIYGVMSAVSWSGLAVSRYAVTMQRLFSANTLTGSINLSGAAPSLMISTGIAARPDQAEIVMSGYAAEAEIGVLAAPLSGVALLTGAQPSMVRAWVASPGHAALKLDGVAAATEVNESIRTTPGAAAVAVVAHAPAIAVQYMEEPGYGTAVMSCTSPAVYRTESVYLPVSAASMSLDCFDPTPSIGAYKNTGDAEAIISGSAPSVMVDKRLVVATYQPVVGYGGPGNLEASVFVYGAIGLCRASVSIAVVPVISTE